MVSGMDHLGVRFEAAQKGSAQNRANLYAKPFASHDSGRYPRGPAGGQVLPPTLCFAAAHFEISESNPSHYQVSSPAPFVNVPAPRFPF